MHDGVMRLKFPILISYAFAKKQIAMFERWVDFDDCEILLDCGAFTAANAGHVITLAEYLAFLDKYKSRLFRYLALDKVKDPIQTDVNLKEMLQKGYKPVPVHIFGDKQDRMDELFEISDYVACAGLRRPGRGQAPKSYVAQKMSWAAGRHVHWLGYTKQSMLTTYRPYSCDSSTHGSAAQFGQMHVYLGHGGWLQCDYKSRAALIRNDKAMQIIFDLGFGYKEIEDPNCWRGATRLGYPCELEISAVVTTDSYVRYSIDLLKKFGVRYFLAVVLGGEREWIHVAGAIARHADKLNLGDTSVSGIPSLAKCP